ncbi:MAG: hypothetical protein HYV51_02405 [Parcubacteria group bacterium]|nr:hypothetical protein [Parcubacteria group bacterium]
MSERDSAFTKKEQVTDQSLVLDGFSEKLRNMQLNNLTAKQQIKVKIFFRHFKSLSYSFFGLSETQLKEFSISELVALEKLISHKARPWAICHAIFTFGVPVIGWIGGAGMFFDETLSSWRYLHFRKQFIKILGNSYMSELLKQNPSLSSSYYSL